MKPADVQVSTVITYCRNRLRDEYELSSSECVVILLAAELDKLLDKLRDQELRKPLVNVESPQRMRLRCEKCGELHIDEGEWATKPHKHHRCSKCGLVWQPALVPTVGVKFLDEPVREFYAKTGDIAYPHFVMKASGWPSGACMIKHCEKCGWPMYVDSEHVGKATHADGQCEGLYAKT